MRKIQSKEINHAWLVAINVIGKDVGQGVHPGSSFLCGMVFMRDLVICSCVKIKVW